MSPFWPPSFTNNDSCSIITYKIKAMAHGSSFLSQFKPFSVASLGNSGISSSQKQGKMLVVCKVFTHRRCPGLSCNLFQHYHKRRIQWVVYPSVFYFCRNVVHTPFIRECVLVPAGFAVRGKYGELMDTVENYAEGKWVSMIITGFYSNYRWKTSLFCLDSQTLHNNTPTQYSVIWVCLYLFIYL